MDSQLAASGLTMAELRNHPCGITVPPQPTRNEKFAEAGFSSMPQWREMPEGYIATPKLLDEYPLIFSDDHTSKNFSASWQRHVPSLREVEGDPALHIHPETAAKFSIADKDWIKVTSP